MTEKPTMPVWFEINKYKDASVLDHEGWRTQIGSRIGLAALLDAGQFKVFDEMFAQLQQAPFFDIGFCDDYGSKEAVFPLTFGIADAIVNVLTPLKLGRRDSCDQALMENGQEGFIMHAHITVDLHASEQEILDNFQEWLTPAHEEHRRLVPRDREPGLTRKVLDRWNRNQILPFQDLLLWYRRNDLVLPSDSVLADWLFVDLPGDKDKVRATRKEAEKIFLLETLRRLSLARYKVPLSARPTLPLREKS